MESQDHRVVVSTHHREEAQHLLARTFPGTRLELGHDDGRPFVFRHSSIGDRRLMANELIVSGPSTMVGALDAGTVGVGMVLAGRFSAEYERRRVHEPDRPFLRPSSAATIRMRDAHLRLTIFDQAALREVAERYEAAGGEHLRLTQTHPVSDEAAAAWVWVAAQVHDTLRDPRAAANPTVRDELFDLAARVLLRCFGEPDRRAAAQELNGSPAAVRRAVAFLEDNAAGTVTVPDVAAAARVSVRSLQTLFRRHLGVTPLEHLHGIRLEAARRDLIVATREDHEGRRSVQDVAVRWGFGNSGRFARIYAARFGERPSETLRRRG